jgi:topoisomerase-4 subunit A
VKKYAIDYLKQLIAKFGFLYPRRTKVRAIEEIDRRAIETKEIKVGIDINTGFIGTKVNSGKILSCTNFDKLLVFDKEGSYKVVSIEEKQYFEKIAWAGLADKKSIISVVYKQKSTGFIWAKRFIIDQFILDKSYRYLDEEGELQLISSKEEVTIELFFPTKPNAKPKYTTVSLKEVPVKSVQTKGVRLLNQKVKKLKFTER